MKQRFRARYFRDNDGNIMLAIYTGVRDEKTRAKLLVGITLRFSGSQDLPRPHKRKIVPSKLKNGPFLTARIITEGQVYRLRNWISETDFLDIMENLRNRGYDVKRFIGR